MNHTILKIILCLLLNKTVEVEIIDVGEIQTPIKIKLVTDNFEFGLAFLCCPLD